MNKNLILHFPFNDPGNKIHDYSHNRNDASLTGSTSIVKDPTKGKALQFSSDKDTCVTTKSIPFESDFTISVWLKTTATTIGWMLNFTGLSKFIDRWYKTQHKEWLHFALVKNGSTVTSFINGSIKDVIQITSTPNGFSLLDGNLIDAKTLLYDLQLYDVAKVAKEIKDIARFDSDIDFFIDGQDFKDYGVYVSECEGINGMLQRKESLSIDYGSYHGKMVDSSRPRYKEREITLSCFIEASSKTSFIEWMNMFMECFMKPGTQRLQLNYDGPARPLVYEVMCSSGVDVTKDWDYNNDLCVGEFKLKLVENEPVKRILKHISISETSEASISVTSHKKLNIYWGDGSHTYNISGTNKIVKHTYNSSGEYFIVITGVIEEIEEMSTNCIEVWKILR